MAENTPEPNPTSKWGDLVKDGLTPQTNKNRPIKAIGRIRTIKTFEKNLAENMNRDIEDTIRAYELKTGRKIDRNLVDKNLALFQKIRKEDAKTDSKFTPLVGAEENTVINDKIKHISNQEIEIFFDELLDKAKEEKKE